MHALGQGRLVSHRHVENIWKGGFLYEFWQFWGAPGTIWSLSKPVFGLRLVFSSLRCNLVLPVFYPRSL